jgi:hypothetical protein
MNSSVPTSRWTGLTTLQDVFAALILFSITCGLCELLSSSVILRFQGQRYPHWASNPGLLRLQIFLLLLPEAILLFSALSGRKKLPETFRARIYIHALCAVSIGFFVLVSSDLLGPMHTSMAFTLVVHFFFSLIPIFKLHGPSLYDLLLLYQALTVEALHYYLW